MNKLFSENPYLLSLPSGDSLAEYDNLSEADLDQEWELEQLRMKCAGALPEGSLFPEAARRTMLLLAPSIEQVVCQGSGTPFLLSATSLCEDVRRCDCIGPARMGFHYERQLTAECQFLLPRQISEKDILAFYRLIQTWNHNRALFRCSAIGAVLALKLAHFEKHLEA